jgi:putative addiction module killer protein
MIVSHRLHSGNGRLKVSAFLAANGDCPFSEWLDAQRDSRVKAAILRRIDYLEQGNLGDCKSVGTGLTELRLHLGPGYRIYLAIRGNEALLLWAGTKGTQPRDIAHAQRYWNDQKGTL